MNHPSQESKFRLRRTGNKIRKQKSNKHKKMCSICFEKFSIRKGTIENCKHSFCYTCIENWAKKEQTCPICRQEFKTLLEVNTETGEIKQQKVESQKKNQATTQNYPQNRISLQEFFQRAQRRDILMEQMRNQRRQTILMQQSTLLDYYQQLRNRLS